ncbi:MAG: hypothetical protein SGJ03_16620 [Alphaproteobacteria bacterium]|nr:hypothetical protein [Alphaproteobacteria bacterium]
MGRVIMGNQSRGTSPLGTAGEPGVLGIVFVLSAGWVAWSLFEVSLALAIGVIGFVAVCGFLLYEVIERMDMADDPGPFEHAQQVLGAILLLLAILGVLLLYPLVIGNHFVAFATAGWTITGLFYASLVAGVWIAASALGRILAMIAGAAAVAALSVLPAPAMSADPTDKESEWRITLSVVDHHANPLHNAVAQCTAAMVWEGEGPVQFHPHLLKLTDDGGIATFTFHEDTRLKVAVCTALMDSQPMEWLTSDATTAERTLYPPKSVVMASPFAGGNYKLTVKLEPKAGACSPSVEAQMRSLNGKILRMWSADGAPPSSFEVLDLQTECRVQVSWSGAEDKGCRIGGTYRQTQPSKWFYIDPRLRNTDRANDVSSVGEGSFECE